MELKAYVQDIARRNELAKTLGKSPDYLWQIGAGIRRASPQLAQEIHDATGGKVSRAEVRPDIWGRRGAVA